MSSRKIRIFPDAEQINLFNKCFGTTRYIYNNTLASIKTLYEFAIDQLKVKAKKGCIHMITEKKYIRKNGSKTTKKVTKRCGKKIHNNFFCPKHKNKKPKYNVPLNFQYWRNTNDAKKF